MKIKLSTNIVIGILLVIIAIGYLGNIFEVWNFTLFFPGWWTLFIIIPSVVSMVSNGFKPVSSTFLIVGAMLLVKSLGILPEWLARSFIPLLILAIGFFIIFNAKTANLSKFYIALFSGRTPNYNGKLFDGAICTALFGGIELKLDKAEITDGSTIYAAAIFGGIDISLPQGVNVETNCLPIFGGISESKLRVPNDGFPTIKINAVAIFGGIDVK